MHLPTWDELIPEQRDVLDVPHNLPLFVAGPPGCGKTVLAVRRAEAVADADCSVHVITYNRMLRRLVSLLGKLDASTMQTFVTLQYRRRIGSKAPKLANDPYALDWPAILNNFDESTRPPVSVEHAVIDEGQDLPVHFYQFISKHGAPVLSVFADENQALRPNATSLEQIKQAGHLPDPILLSSNHRNTSPIAALACHFYAGNLPVPSVRRRVPGADKPRLVRTDSHEDTGVLISRLYKNRGGSVGVIVKSNDTGQAMHDVLQIQLPDARVDFYSNRLKNEDSINVLEPGITILNVDSVKGQEFDAVFLLELESFIPCVTEQRRRAMYMLCSRARDQLLLIYGPNELTKAASASLPNNALLERT